MWRADPIINVLPAGGGTPAWVNGLFILGGALGGGGLAYISSWRSDKRRDSTEAKLAFDQLKAQDDRRWHGPIRDHVAKYHGTTMALAAAAEEARARFPQLFGRDPSDPYSLERQAWAWWIDELTWRGLSAAQKRRTPGAGQTVLPLAGHDTLSRHHRGPHPRTSNGRADFAAARRYLAELPQAS